MTGDEGWGKLEVTWESGLLDQTAINRIKRPVPGGTKGESCGKARGLGVGKEWVPGLRFGFLDVSEAGWGDGSYSEHRRHSRMSLNTLLQFTVWSLTPAVWPKAHQGITRTNEPSNLG